MADLTGRALRMMGVDPGAAMQQLEVLSASLQQTAANTAAIAQSLAVIDRRLTRLEHMILSLRSDTSGATADSGAPAPGAPAAVPAQEA